MNYRMLIVLSFLALSLSVAAKGAYAAEGDVKPGWGYGDSNHVHVGPSGISDRPTYAKVSYTEKSDVVQKSEYHSIQSKVLEVTGIGNISVIVSDFLGKLGF